MTSGKQARADRQAKIAAATPKQTNTRTILGVVIALVAVIAVGVVIWMATRGSGTNDPTAAKGIPAGATASDGGIVVNAGGLKSGLPTLDVYEDFQCPACKTAEGILGPTIKQLASSGSANVVYHMKTFLDDNLRNDSSKRAALGATCAADAGKFLAYHDNAFSGQPAREGDGFTDLQLEGFAVQSGISGSALDTWKACVKDKRYASYLTKVEDRSARDKVNATPTFRINGQEVKFNQVKTTQEYVDQFVAALTKAGVKVPAAGAGTAPSVGATATASATATK